MLPIYMSPDDCRRRCYCLPLAGHGLLFAGEHQAGHLVSVVMFFFAGFGRESPACCAYGLGPWRFIVMLCATIKPVGE